MNYRFLEVAKAHAATFEWLLLDPRRKEELTMIRKTEFGALNHKAYQNQPTPAPPPLRESGDRFKHEANLAFNNWLRSGNGIFHISGKPGAGKSTLMKFICQSPKTQEYLGDWCGNDQLIFAKVFFWRQGQEDQKNLAGLTRSLLSQVLTACPELISVAFPRQWAETSKKAFIIQIEQGDVQEAFDRLLCDADSFKGRKFAFFVDGLDEYSGRHIDLVDKLMTWTSQHPANLKVCVASREWNEFMVGFSECPKLRIHHCTEQDITRYINDKFDGLCRHLTQFSAGDMKGLASEIVEKAEGVFVWVRLVLNAVEDGVLNGDGIPDLRVKVKTFPNELNALYQHLFDSIPESYRSKAFEALTLTRFWCWKKAIPLLQYWFLNEVIADPDFAMNMAIRDDQPDRDMLIQITRRQIYGRCKGFLEVCSSRIWGGPEDGVVTFMHSTVLEFLDSPHIKLTIDHTIGHVDFFYRTCQTFLATLKYGCPIEYYIRKDKFGPESSVYADISEITRFERLQAVDYKVLCQRPINPWFSSFLRMLEEVITKRFPTYETRKYAAPLLITCRSPTGFDHTQYNILLLPPNLIIQALAIENLIPEFLEQRDLGCFIENVHTLRSDRTLDIAQLLWGRLPLVPPISLSIQFIDLYERRYRIIRLLLGEGLNPNVKSSLWRGLTLFECCICYYLFSQDQEVGPLGLLELCLRYGATSHMCLIFGQTYRRKDGVKRKIKVGIHRAQDDLEEVDVIYVCATVPIVSFALQRNGVLSLHDVFKFWFPKDFERLHRLLDLQDDAGSTPSSYPIGGLDEHLSDDEHDCTQVELNGPIFPRAKSSWLLSDSYKIVENDKPDNRGSDAALFPIPKIH
jgi:hypothetical protein